MDVEQAQNAAYVLGHSAHELERLINQARLYEPFTAQVFRDAGITTGMRVLDVGCGSGDVSFLAARMVGPTGQVVGIDRASAAVTTASRRAQNLELPNTRFLVGDAGEMAFEEPFDAVVGRCVLQFCSDPSAVLRQLSALVRPGGVIAFQEIDWSGCRALPALPTFSQCIRWGVETLKHTGADPYMGPQLFGAFTHAGLPAPMLYLHAGIGAGADHPVYSNVAGLMRTLLPAMEKSGVARADEVDVDTLAKRISDEAVAAQATIIWVSLVGAVARKPTE